MLQKKFVISLALIASLAFTAGCSSAAEPDAAAVSSAAEAAAAAPTPDLAGVPEIVATVNGEQITKADFARIYETQFAQVQQQAQLGGQELDQAQLRKQTAEGLVNTELLIQEAAKKKIFATSKDLDAALADVAKSNSVSTAEFLTTMKSQGLDEDAVRLQLKTQLEVERLIAKEIGDFTPTEKDLKAAYQVVVDQYASQEATDAEASKVPAYKEIKSDLSEQLKLQKESASVKKYAAQLRKAAKVTTNM